MVLISKLLLAITPMSKTVAGPLTKGSLCPYNICIKIVNAEMKHIFWI